MMKKSYSASYRDAIKSEFELVCSVTQHLRGEAYRVRLEVSNMGQSIDVVATKGRYVTAIEAKKSNWKKALDQCRAHTLVADFIAIALALKETPPELSDFLHKSGWGLLMYDPITDGWMWEIKPKRNERVWEPQRRHFSQNLKKVGYAS